MKLLTINLLILSCFFAQAQSISVSNLRVDNSGQVSFAYSVSPKHSDRESYQLKIFSSADNFGTAIPLELDPIRVGTSENVSFNGPDLIGDYSGSLRFKFKIEATAFPVRIISTANKFKSGKSITISWDDFHRLGTYDIELYEGGFISKTLASNHRGTILSTRLPKKMIKGIYQVRVTPTNNQNLASEDYPVTIAAGGGAGMLVLAGGALAGAGVFVLSGGGDDPGDGDTLPDPPSPGGN